MLPAEMAGSVVPYTEIEARRKRARLGVVVVEVGGRPSDTSSPSSCAALVESDSDMEADLSIES